MRHDGDNAADPPATKDAGDDPGNGAGGGDGGTGGVVDMAKAIVTKLLPDVPPATAGVLVLVVFGVAAILVATAFASNVVLGLIALLILAGVVASVVVVVVLKGDGTEKAASQLVAPPAAPAHADTMTIADRLNPDQRDAICQIVGSAVGDVADALRADPKKLRGNVFACDGTGTLRIMPEFDHNMTYVKERSISMQIGQGNNGFAWANNRPNVAIRRGGSFGLAALPIDQEKRIVKGLSWIISVPVFVPGQPIPPVWVLNVDGVRDRRTEKDLAGATGRIAWWAEKIGQVLSGVGQHEVRAQRHGQRRCV